MGTRPITPVAVAQAVSMYLDNPGLRWDGKRLPSTGDRIVEEPQGWRVSVADRRESDGTQLGTPTVIHKPRGFSIDGAFIPFSVAFQQDHVILPAGVHWLTVACESHVVKRPGVTTSLGNNSFWRVLITDEDGVAHESPAVPLLETKGEQSFAVRVIVPGRAQTVTVTVSYASMWGVTDGAMLLKRIDFDDTPGERRWSGSWSVDLPGGVPESEPVQEVGEMMWTGLLLAMMRAGVDYLETRVS